MILNMRTISFQQIRIIIKATPPVIKLFTIFQNKTRKQVNIYCIAKDFCTYIAIRFTLFATGRIPKYIPLTLIMLGCCTGTTSRGWQLRRQQ